MVLPGCRCHLLEAELPEGDGHEGQLEASGGGKHHRLPAQQPRRAHRRKLRRRRGVRQLSPGREQLPWPTAGVCVCVGADGGGRYEPVAAAVASISRASEIRKRLQTFCSTQLDELVEVALFDYEPVSTCLSGEALLAATHRAHARDRQAGQSPLVATVSNVVRMRAPLSTP